MERSATHPSGFDQGRWTEMSTTRRILGLAALAAAVSCAPEDQRTETLDARAAMQERANWPPAVVAQLDSGSAAFRARDLERALEHYTRVTEMEPEIGAGWFGVYMAQEALGAEAEAAAALERAQELVPSASMIHEDGSGDGGDGSESVP